VSSTEREFDAVRKWAASLPSAGECARTEVEPFLDMTPEDRLVVWSRPQRSMDALVRLNPPIEDPADSDFWRHWRDPAYGRPR